MSASPRKEQRAVGSCDPEAQAGKRFSRLYRRLTGKRCLVAEGSADTPSDEFGPVREKIVRCLWFDQFLDSGNLKTEDGRRLAVFLPGHWNEGAGPDFKNAEFALGEAARIRGDVEVHVSASDWNRHNHANDPAYAGVALHVVLHNDLATTTVSHRAGEIPQLVLQDQLSADLSEIVRSLDPDGYPRMGCGREGTCCRSIRAFARDEQWVARFLDIAGDERILCKAERFEALMKRATPDDVLYRALMEAMGYGNNRRGFRLLAEAASLEHLRRLTPVDAEVEERRLVIQAILYGVAGFLNRGSSEPSDPASRNYVEKLSRHWRSAQRDLAGSRFDQSVWVLKRTRPTNHPVRRIAGISAFLASHLHTGLCRTLLAAVERAPCGRSEPTQCRETLKELRALFEETPQKYWARRTAFGPERLSRPARLIGLARAAEMIVNAIIPFLLALSRGRADARVELRLHNVYASLKARGDNAITRYMKRRIFRDAAQGSRVVRTTRRQQGLLQIFHDFCESDTTTCEACGFLAAVEGKTG